MPASGHRASIISPPRARSGTAPDGLGSTAAAVDEVAAGLRSVVAGAWQDALGRPPTETSDFIAEGGDSIRAVALATRLRAALDLEVSIADVLAATTFAGLVDEIARQAGTAGSRPRIVARPPGDRLWISLQQATRLRVERSKAAAARGNTVAFSLDVHGADRSAVLDGLAAVWHRHDALRTVFPDENHGRLLADGTGPIVVGESDAIDRFDLAKGPLMAARVVSTGPRHHRLDVAADHIVFDGYSAPILISELAIAAHDPAALAARPLPYQYADFAAAQRAWIRGDRRRRILEDWRSGLAGGDPLPSMPLTAIGPTLGRAARRVHGLTRAEVLLATRRASDFGVTPFTYAFAQLGRAVRSTGHAGRFAVMTPRAARNWPESQRLIGFFSTIALLRLNLADLGESSAMDAAKSVVLRALASEDIPYTSKLRAAFPAAYRAFSRGDIVDYIFLQVRTEALQSASSGEVRVSMVPLPDQTTGWRRNGGINLIAQLSSERPRLVADFAEGGYAISDVDRLLRVWATALRGDRLPATVQ